MNFNIDSVIFIGFLVANLILGLYSSRGIKNIAEYAVGNRNFSTATIVATIAATWISGEWFYDTFSKDFDNGLRSMWVALADPLCLLIIGVFFAPRMAEFLGKLSIAEAMGNLFGERVRIITAISGLMVAAGIIATEIKMAGFIFEYAVGIPSLYGIIISAIIVTLYSSLGGIKSVTFTDIIQFFTFGAVIPLIAYVILISIDNLDMVTNFFENNTLFDYSRKAFDFSQPRQIKSLFVFLLFIVPGIDPAIFQRVLMARNTKQIRQSFVVAAILCLLLTIAIKWTVVLMFSINPSLETSEVVKQIILNCSQYIGMKGLIFTGVMAMILSTVDSFINSSAVLVVHDICKPLKIKFIQDELFAARIASVLIGVCALGFAFHEGSLFQLLLISESFYTPFVVAPFIMAVCGFRSTEKPVLLGMMAGFITIVLWDYVFEIEAANSAIFGMFANLIVLMSSHYLLKQPGGWVGIKEPAPLIEIRNERKLRMQRFIRSLKSFNLLDICAKNCPASENLISMLGLFVMISAFASTHTLSKGYRTQYKDLIDIFYPITLCASTALMSYPLWFRNWKVTKLIGVVWNLTMFFVLICFSLLMVLISQFSEIQLMVFMVNIIIISLVVSWRWGLFTMIVGTTVTTVLYYRYMPETLQEHFVSLQFKIIYLLLMISSAIVVFLKPKQEEHKLTEEKVEHLGVRIGDREEELQKLLGLKSEFLRNLEHEVRTPITGITSMAETLYDNYETMDPKQLKEYLGFIAKSSARFNTYSKNILDLSKLSSLTYELNKTNVNLSELVIERLDRCKRLYLNNKGLEFVTNITPDIQLNCDQHYIASTIDNLIINAIMYSKEGRITITLEKIDANVEFSIQDEGIGIPPSELFDIFGAFIVSSKTRTPSGGRGVGTALCKKVIEVHQGKIWAESDGEKGATFRFVLPCVKGS